MNIQSFLTAIILLLSPVLSFGKGQEISMLGGRFSFVFPKGAKWSVGATNVQTSDQITWVSFEKAGKSYHFVASDFLHFYNDDFMLNLTKEMYGGAAPVTEQLFNKDSVLMIGVDGSKSTPWQPTYTVFIRNDDNTVSKITAMVEHKGIPIPSGPDRIMREVFMSFKKGNSKLDLSERVEKHIVLRGNTMMTMHLPVNYFLTWIKDTARRYESHHLSKVIPYGSNGVASLMIMIGFLPETYNYGYADSLRMADTEGVFMNRKMSWQNFRQTSSFVSFFRGQLFADDDIKKGIKIDIAMWGGELQVIEELTQIAESIVFKNVN